MSHKENEHPDVAGETKGKGIMSEKTETELWTEFWNRPKITCWWEEYSSLLEHWEEARAVVQGNYQGFHCSQTQTERHPES